MLKFTNLEQNKINDFIKHTINNDTLEFEIRVNSKITNTEFVNVIRKIKSLGLKNISNNSNILDVFFEDNNNIRMTIHDDENINNYCNSNSIKDIKEKIEFIEKKRFSIGKNEIRPLDLRNYNLRLNLKDENNLGIKTKNVSSIITRFGLMNKSFRYKKRYSFLSQDKNFRFDLTIIKSSSIEEIKIDKRNLPKKDVSDIMKRFVVKPKGVKMAFYDWWDSLGENHIVSIRENRYNKTLYFKNLEESETLTNSLSYEIELEFIGNKNTKDIEGKNLDEKQKFIQKKLEENLSIILKALQQNEFIIGNNEKKNVRDTFYSLTGQSRFSDSMPLAVTLEKENIVEMDNLEYINNINIRRNYCVLEKTDGERCILFIDNNGIMYLVNRQNDIIKTGVKCMTSINCIIDGEYVTKNISGKNIRKYLAFDLYFSQGEDYRERILNRNHEQRNSNDIEKSRLEELEDVIANFNLVRDKCVNEFIIEMKIFKYGDMDEYDTKTQTILDKYNIALQDEILKGEQGDKKLIDKLNDRIRTARQDTSIFDESNKILQQIASNTYDYKTDGLIFTPVNLTVGEGNIKRNVYGGSWDRIFKWKPVEENSIDFKVVFLKDDKNNDIEKFIDDGREVNKYKKVKLLVGYDIKSHSKLNGLKVVNEDPNYQEGYNNIPFEPTDPFMDKIYESYLLIEKNGLVCEEGDIIKDGNIVEFSYNHKADTRFCWIPKRIRSGPRPNSFQTACNIWRTIFNPITVDMITQGLEKDDNNKYYSESDNSNKELKNLYSFHNLVKKYSLQENTSKGNTLLDMSCGQLGDLFKWIGCELSMVVGMDINKHNLTNITKGATTRVIELKEKNASENANPLLDNIFLIWGDGSKNIRNSSAGLDSLNKFYIDVLWGNVINRRHIERLAQPKMKTNRGKCKDGFDVISNQFAIHYFFKNKDTLHNFLTNVSQNLKVGGKMISTCFDGSRVFKLLEKSDFIERRDEQNKLLWRLEKKYTQNKMLNTDKSLGIAIDVYMESFTSFNEEYLVNIDYLKSILGDYGLEIINLKDFGTCYKDLSANGYIKNELTEECKELSFLNTIIVLHKKKEMEVIQSGGALKETLLDEFLSKKSILEDVSDDENIDYEQTLISDNNTGEEDNIIGYQEESEEEDINQENSEKKILFLDDEEVNNESGNNLNEIELTNPVDQADPVDQAGQADLVDQADQADPVDQVDPVEQTNPVGPVGQNNVSSSELSLINRLNDDKKELDFVNIGNNTLEEVDLNNMIGGGGGKKISNELNITRLDDIDLSPDLNETDMESLVNTNLEIVKPILSDNNEELTNDLDSNDILNSISNEMTELSSSMNTIKDANSGQLLMEHKDMPTERKEDTVKVIKLDIDKNTMNMIKQ